MRTPLGLLRFIAKAGLNVVSNGLAGDFAVEVLPELAEQVWKWWHRGRLPEQMQSEVQALARLAPGEARRVAERVAGEAAAGRPEAVRRALATYLAQVPAAIRRSQSRAGG